jgi:uncharacterized protein YggE
MKKLFLLTAATLMLSVQAFAQNANDRPMIIVSGQAEVMVVPDEVVFKLEADNLNLDLTAAKAATDRDVKEVFALSRAYKIAPQNVQTDYVRVNKRYTDYVQGKPREFRGYGVSQTVVILLKDLSRFDSLLSDLLKAGISDVSDVTFRASQMRKYMDEARAQAMRAAQEKAIALAGAVGQKIGRANNITEVGINVSSAYSSEDSSQASSNYSNTVSSQISRNVPDNQGTIAPGMISITARVTVSFELN